MNIDISYLFQNQAHEDDNYTILYPSEEKLFVSVMDGVTTAIGSFASNKLKESFDDTPPQTPQELASTIEYVHQEIQGKSATTVAAMLIEEDTAHFIGSGDSPIYLLRESNLSLILPLDNSSIYPSLLKYGVGMKDIKLHKTSLQLKEEDKIMLATDGITDNFSESELKKILSQDTTYTMKKQLEEMLDEKRDKSQGHLYNFFKEDDSTAIFVKW